MIEIGNNKKTVKIKDTNISHTQGSYTPGYGSPVFGQTITQASQTVSDSTNYGEGGTAEAEEIGAAIASLKLVTTVDTNNVQVYPVVIFSADCLGCVSLSGYDAVIPKVVMPQPAVTDPLGQSGSVGWKSWYACQILNEDWIYRIECGASTIS